MALQGRPTSTSPFPAASCHGARPLSGNTGARGRHLLGSPVSGGASASGSVGKPLACAVACVLASESRRKKRPSVQVAALRSIFSTSTIASATRCETASREVLNAGMALEAKGVFLPGVAESISNRVARLTLPPNERAAQWRQGEAMSSRQRGPFLVFEGLDRSGKTTHSKLVADHLQQSFPGREIHWMCFPDRSTQIGKLINNFLQRGVDLSDDAIHLLFAANRWEVVESLTARLGAGHAVICDRYAFSGVAYSAAKGLDVEWCKSSDSGLPQPDCVVYMRVDPEEAAAREGYGAQRYENLSMQTRTGRAFLDPALRAGIPEWHDIDSSRALETNQADIRERVGKVMKSFWGDASSSGAAAAPPPLQLLWAGHEEEIH